MKNLKRIFFMAFIATAFMALSIVPLKGYSQKKTKEETIAAFPKEVSGILQNSCVGCHNDQSKGKSKEFLNLSEWDKLDHKKQAKTSKSISKMAKKGIMPPAKFLEKMPQAALTEEQKTALADWANRVKKNK